MVGFNTYRFGFDNDPFADLERVSRQFHSLLGERKSGGSTLPVNLWASDDEAVATVEVPGVKATDIELELEDQTLRIRVERKAEPEAEDHRFYRRERTHGQVVRIIRLPYEVESDQVSAQAQHGVLTIRLPRRADTKPRKILVNKNK